jgi:CheY-like chemotaxis protein
VFLKPESRFFFPVLRFALFFLLVLPGWGYCQNTRIVMVTEHWPPFRINDGNSPSGFRGIDIPIILCTGYSEMVSEQSAKYYGITNFLLKPIIFNDLAMAVQEALQRKG